MKFFPLSSNYYYPLVAGILSLPKFTSLAESNFRNNDYPVKNNTLNLSKYYKSTIYNKTDLVNIKHKGQINNSFPSLNSSVIGQNQKDQILINDKISDSPNKVSYYNVNYKNDKDKKEVNINSLGGRDMLENEYKQNEPFEQSYSSDGTLPILRKNYISRKTQDNEDVITKIHNLLDKYYKAVIIQGMSGGGKTYSAIKYAQENSEERIPIFIDAKNAIKIKMFLQNKLDYYEVSSYGEVAHRLNVYLEHQRQSGKKYLLIFDDAPSYEVIAPYIPNLPSNARVLITTQNPHFFLTPGRGFETKRINLEFFSKEEAKRYINSNLEDREIEKEKNKIDLLINKEYRCLPGRLEMSVNYLNNNKLESIENYCNSTQYQHDEYYILNLLEYNSSEWQLLQFAHVLNPDEIPCDILHSALDEIPSGISQSILDKIMPNALQEIINNLKKKSLIKIAEAANSKTPAIIRLDKAKHKAIKDFYQNHPHLDTVSETSLYNTLIEILNKAMPIIDFEENKAKTHLYASNVITLLNQIESRKLQIENNEKADKTVEFSDINLTNLAKLNQKLGDYYRELLLDYDNALYYHKKCRDIYLENNMPEESYQNVKQLLNIGEVYIGKAELDHALKYFEKVRFLAQDKLSEKPVFLDFDETDFTNLYVSATSNIAAIYTLKDYNRGAINMLEECLKYSANIPEYHLANIYHNLGENNRNLAQTEAEEERFEKSLENHSKALNLRKQLQKTLEIAKSYHCIGTTYLAKGEFEVSLDNLNKALELRKENLPELHIDIAKTYHSIGLAYKIAGKDLSQTIENYNKALEIFKEILPANHPEIAMIYNNLGTIYRKQEEYVDSLKDQSKALNIYNKNFGINHSNFILSLGNLGRVYKSLGDNNKSKELKLQGLLLGKSYKLNVSVAEELLNELKSEAPEMLQSGKNREPLKKFKPTSENEINIKQKLQEPVLNTVYELAFNANAMNSDSWNNIVAYLNNKYISSILGKEYSDAESLEAAKMLIFEAISLGTLHAGGENKTILQAFKRAQPELVKKIQDKHPEYFVDGSIVRELVSDEEIKKELLGGEEPEHIDIEDILNEAKELITGDEKDELLRDDQEGKNAEESGRTDNESSEGHSNNAHHSGAAAARAEGNANQTGASANGESANLEQITLEPLAGCASIQETAARPAGEDSYISDTDSGYV